MWELWWNQQVSLPGHLSAKLCAWQRHQLLYLSFTFWKWRCQIRSIQHSSMAGILKLVPLSRIFLDGWGEKLQFYEESGHGWLYLLAWPWNTCSYVDLCYHTPSSVFCQLCSTHRNHFKSSRCQVIAMAVLSNDPSQIFKFIITNSIKQVHVQSTGWN